MQNLHNEAKIENYLESVRQRLLALPEEEREAELTELRSHLLDLARAHEELGMTKQEAMQAALKQFGEPKAVGTNLRRVWEQGQKRQLPGTVLSAALWAFSVSLPISLINIPLSRLTLGNQHIVSWHPQLMFGLWGVGFIECLFIGYMAGRKAPRHAFTGIFLSRVPFLVLGTIVLHFYTLPHLNAQIQQVDFRSSAMTTGLVVGLQLLGAGFGRKHFLANRQRKQKLAG